MFHPAENDQTDDDRGLVDTENSLLAYRMLLKILPELRGFHLADLNFRILM